MTIGQTTDEAKAGRLGKAGNAPYRHFFPALRVAFWRTPACVASLAKPVRLGAKPRRAGSSPQNAMQLMPGW